MRLNCREISPPAPRHDISSHRLGALVTAFPAITIITASTPQIGDLFDPGVRDDSSSYIRAERTGPVFSCQNTERWTQNLDLRTTTIKLSWRGFSFGKCCHLEKAKRGRVDFLFFPFLARAGPSLEKCWRRWSAPSLPSSTRASFRPSKCYRGTHSG